MAKNKLFKFNEIKKIDHVLEASVEKTLNKEIDYKGNWNKRSFENEQPIVLELGGGKGEYAVGLAKKYPNQNFDAVDIKGNRIYIGAKEAEEAGLKNLFFLRAKV